MSSGNTLLAHLERLFSFLFHGNFSGHICSHRP
jgi:hypothetical protein